MYKIIIDTSYWISLYDPTDDPNKTADAERISSEIEEEEIIIPFPTLYEFVNSRLSRKEAKLEFEKLLKKPNINRLDDGKYKEKALENFFIKSKYDFTDISLVDEVLKLIIEDKKVKIDYIVSFDSGLINHAISKGIRTI
jgi:predicted nucleic acid-binding protein